MDGVPTGIATVKSGFGMKNEDPAENGELKVTSINLLLKHN